MRALRQSPLFRIAVFTLAVLFAHTLRANTQPIALVRPLCGIKLSTAQPDSNKKLFSAIKRSAAPAQRKARVGTGGALHTSAPASLYAHTAGHIALARAADAIPAQRRAFALRL